MPESPLQVAGAQIQPSAAAALHNNEFFTGMWTHGNPLGPGAVPYLYQKFYAAARYDRMIGGLNVEISSKLTPIRRPGNSVYNAATFPPINRFYEFRTFQNNLEDIRIMASCDAAIGSSQGTVREVTSGVNLSLFSKQPGAGRTGFQGVGNILYMGDGSTTKKWIQSNQVWTATFAANISAIAKVTLDPRTPSQQDLLVFTLATPRQPLAVNTVVTPAGLTANPAFNAVPLVYLGTTYSGLGANQIAFPYPAGLPALAPGVETGTLAGPNSTYANGAFIVDSNNNLQLSMGSQTGTIQHIQVESYDFPLGITGRKITLYLDPLTPLDVLDNISLTLAGLTTVGSLNGATPYTVDVISSSQIVITGVFFGVPVTPYSVETGTATTGTGVAGATQPAWNATPGLVTQDGTLQWVNMGPAVQDWGDPGPTTAPSVSQADAPTIYPAWAAHTWYAPKFIIVDSNGNLQLLTTAGTTGGAAPAWNVVTGGTTADNTAVWTNLGNGAWAASTVYAVGAVVKATFTFTITVPQQIQTPDGHGGFTVKVIYVTQQITVTCLFTCTVAGTSGLNQPAWSNGLNTTVTDNTVQWQNGGTPPAWPGAAQVLSLATRVLDSNGNIQFVQGFGESDAAAPTWEKAIGATTPDNSLRWLNEGPYSAASQFAWVWAYSGKNSITKHISTASPVSNPLVVSADKLAVIQGNGLADPQWDRIVLWRTVQNGSILMYDDEFPNPGANQTWIYTDTNLDPSSVSSPNAGQLNFLITAPINSVNNPPPASFVPHAYYLGRIWGFDGNVLRWSGGPDTITGSGNEAFPPLNSTVFPSTGVTCWATSIGLICYTLSDVWVVLGQGTAGSPFYVINFQEGVGLASADTFAVHGSTAYGMLTDGQVVSMDPGAGELEIGFPIGDLLDQLDPATAYFAWHQGASSDTALYVADGIDSWYRMSPVAAPESGNVWSPAATIVPGVKAIASVEISPGVKRLLLGPQNPLGGPILMRDASTNKDNGTAYEAYFDLGSIVMAQPGTTVNVQFIVTEEQSIAGSSPAYVKARFDEIGGPYEPIDQTSLDPPNLPASDTVTSTRFWATKNLSICRHMQLRIGWIAEDFPNELFTYTIYGRLPEKARK